MDSISPIPLPGWLAETLTARPKRVRDVPMPLPGKGSRYARAALDSETRNVAHAADGTRNDTLLRAARALGRFIASGDLTRMEVEQALSSAAAGNATESERYYDDVITRGLDWSIANNPAGGRSAA